VHPSPEEKISSWLSVAFDIVSKIALIVAMVLFMLFAAGVIVVLWTPELSKQVYEDLDK